MIVCNFFGCQIVTWFSMYVLGGIGGVLFKVGCQTQSVAEDMLVLEEKIKNMFFSKTNLGNVFRKNKDVIQKYKNATP